MRDSPRVLGPGERRILLLALGGHGPALEGSAQALDWPALIEAARAAKLLPVLASRALGARIDLDRAVQDTLRESLEATAVRNTLLLAELASASRLLQQGGIAHVALKGAVLMARCYENPALRHAVDLDLLVDPKALDRAVAVLRAHGYVEPSYTQTLAFDGRTWARALDAPHLHASTPLQSPTGIVLDLHRRVPVVGFEADGGFDRWHARARPAIVSGVEVPTCHDDDLARHLCEHFALQNHGDPLEVPRLLCDLRALFHGKPPWARLLSSARPRAKVALSIARTLYDAAFHAAPSPPAHVRLLQRVAIADPTLAPTLAEIAALRGYGARLAADLVHRPSFALAKLLPARAYMVEQFGVDAASPHLYALYARRLAAVVLPPLRDLA